MCSRALLCCYRAGEGAQEHARLYIGRAAVLPCHAPATCSITSKERYYIVYITQVVPELAAQPAPGVLAPAPAYTV